MRPVYRILIGVIAMAGMIGVLPIITAHLRGWSCPMIGPLPACYLVLFAYSSVALSVLLNARRRKIIFLVGWTPLFIVATAGSVLELMGREACPRTGYGVPTCFISLFMVLVLAAVFVAGRGSRAAPSSL